MRCRLIVSGRVQGVFYRKYTKQAALEKHITGYVRNLDNGDVEIIAEGTSEQLNWLEQWCYVGSPHSKVTDVKREALDSTSTTGANNEDAKKYHSFIVLH